MAARRSKTRSPAKKEPKARRQKKAAPVAVEAVEEVPGSGLGFEGGIVLTTTVLLIGACVLVWAAGY